MLSFPQSSDKTICLNLHIGCEYKFSKIITFKIAARMYETFPGLAHFNI